MVAGGQLSKAGLGWVGLLPAAHRCRHCPCELILRPSLKDGGCPGKALCAAMTAKCKRAHQTTQIHFLPLFGSCLLPSHCPEPVTWPGPKLRHSTAEPYGKEGHMVKMSVVKMCSGDGEELMLRIQSTQPTPKISQCACKLTCGWVHMQVMEVPYEECTRIICTW